jgi:hypothetical protein
MCRHSLCTDRADLSGPDCLTDPRALPYQGGWGGVTPVWPQEGGSWVHQSWFVQWPVSLLFHRSVSKSRDPLCQGSGLPGVEASIKADGQCHLVVW